MSGPLEGKAALVAGATRGAARGIAVGLGAAVATAVALTPGWMRSQPSRRLAVPGRGAGHGPPADAAGYR